MSDVEMDVDDPVYVPMEENTRPNLSWENINGRFEVYKSRDMAMERIINRYNEQEKKEEGVPQKEYQTRVLFRSWPRDPKGPVMKITPIGKQAGNGYELWGATLYDFYYLNRIPGLKNAITQSTGSKLAAWMKDIGEVNHAKHELLTAQKEPDPILKPPFKAGEWIRDFELRANRGDWNKFKDPKKADDKNKKNSKSIYRPSNQPDPWPFVPFSTPIHHLEEKIPFHLLPQKLYVHDPWNRLETPQYHSDMDQADDTDVQNYDEDEEEDTEEDVKGKGKQKEKPVKPKLTIKGWSDVPDVIRTYTLRLSESAQKEREVQDAFLRYNNSKLEEQNSPKMNQKEEYLHLLPQEHIPQLMHTRYGNKFKDRPVLVKIPPRPQRPRVPEAHLYIKPSNKIAIGHHSFVYRAELEVPRWLVVEDQLCRQCVLDNLIFDPVKEEASYAEEIPNVEDDKDDEADKDDEDQQMDVDKQNDSNKAEKLPPSERQAGPFILNDDEGYFEKYRTKKKKKKSKSKKKDKGKELVKEVESNANSESEDEEDENFIYGTYSGPPIYASTTAKWQNSDLGPFCEHLNKQGGKTLAIPPTAKVGVVAKLSLCGDPHLENEAHIYQSFPSHLSEHWSGYNLIRPMHEPVPLGAVVPQFYGYYMPDNVKALKDTWLSPILLMENCGEPVNPKTLPIDERRECIGLLLRFHLAGYLHGSVFQRNILMQPGPLAEPPIFRSKENLSFRLVDFGRTVKTKPPEQWNEEREGFEELRLAFELY